MLVKVCKSMIEAKQIVTASETTTNTYTTIAPTIFNDAVCTCLGFHFRGHCRHVDDANSLSHEFIDTTGTKTVCPRCQGPLIEWESDPTYA